MRHGSREKALVEIRVAEVAFARAAELDPKESVYQKQLDYARRQRQAIEESR
jgi:hypothetical protein